MKLSDFRRLIDRLDDETKSSEDYEDAAAETAENIGDAFGDEADDDSDEVVIELDSDPEDDEPNIRNIFFNRLGEISEIADQAAKRASKIAADAGEQAAKVADEAGKKAVKIAVGAGETKDRVQDRVQAEVKARMFYCPNCGRRINQNDKYCRFCGARMIKITDDADDPGTVIRDSARKIKHNAEGTKREITKSINEGRKKIDEASKTAAKKADKKKRGIFGKKANKPAKDKKAKLTRKDKKAAKKASKSNKKKVGGKSFCIFKRNK